MAYFETLDDVKARTVAPPELIDDLERKYPGWLLEYATGLQGEIDARLRKRTARRVGYAAPFSVPVPPIVLQWLGYLLTPDIYAKDGVAPSDAQQETILKNAERAREQVLEAANSETGLFDLPLDASTSTTAFDEPATLRYSEQSPFTGKHLQYDAVRYNRRYG